MNGGNCIILGQLAEAHNFYMLSRTSVALPQPIRAWISAPHLASWFADAAFRRVNKEHNLNAISSPHSSKFLQAQEHIREAQWCRWAGCLDAPDLLRGYVIIIERARTAGNCRGSIRGFWP